ncbi:MAG: hypothetical protein LUG84_03205 [Akkermansiaceae bacterium]|nr:hypothetical protein [Akkermansiaceae bacterium]
MDSPVERLHRHLSLYYDDRDWPALQEQARTWARTRPLEGLRILDATPVYRNTLAKYMPLLAAGARLSVPERSTLPSDGKIRGMLPEFGIAAAEKGKGEFDIILDCAGMCHSLHPTLGAVELTRTGAYRYERPSTPVYLADAGRIKKIETVLGTGESFFRALRQAGFGEWSGRRLMVIGYGKVGRGIVLFALKHGMRVSVADVADKSNETPPGVEFLHLGEKKGAGGENERVTHAVCSSWCAVTATGRFHAMRNRLDAGAVCRSSVLLANMGVDDEWGPDYPAERILNGKRPFNFILEEPTAMRYIETTLALHNAGALELLTEDLPRALIVPSPDVEERLLAVTRASGRLSEELKMIE